MNDEFRAEALLAATKYVMAFIIHHSYFIIPIYVVSNHRFKNTAGRTSNRITAAQKTPRTA
jgi:hypothetical protein